MSRNEDIIIIGGNDSVLLSRAIAAVKERETLIIKDIEREKQLADLKAMPPPLFTKSLFELPTSKPKKTSNTPFKQAIKRLRKAN